MGTKKATAGQFRIKYVHPDNLRDFYINGAWGGITPRHEIYMHVYSERQAIPKDHTFKIMPDDSLKEQKLSTGADVVRLIQASLVMDIHTATSLRDWLDKMIHAIQQRTGGERDEN
ncbi:MAG: hypothetical protein JRF59_09100 [Deltaproteobacteria bacterium]|nr:hypothetical protein [Deltaproteobacteria bacterium]MBW1950411.1 hypothetical protein [Deltaproteobacteria bacterium]MBW2009408.1 hypothetical protein [Deltaproteobacteria bacterium]MBW2347984.1 hypothetical protein [Deltaproteobacteria bacterium]RLB35557.1 MAG: hypothetical protein DRH20_10915 [Deltaproteobacteria bacterium]